ncbi:MAG: NusG domain II-containing protein [Nitrospirales bacterium]|nr:MAG: NusG domain II-containing protein [Nitrospirales bacterium]
MRLKNLFHNTTIADAVLFSLLMLASLSGMFMIHQVVSQGQTVHIEMDGKPVYIMPMDRNNAVSVEGLLGKTRIEIKYHKVRITESPCNNKLCIHQGWTQRGTIICLPNRIIVTIEDGSHQSGTVDAITG